MRQFEIVYDAAEPFKRPVVIDSAEDGMRVRCLWQEVAILGVGNLTNWTIIALVQLTFDPVQQLLTAIEFYDMNRVALKFGRVVIFGGDVSATFMSIYNVQRITLRLKG